MNGSLFWMDRIQLEVLQHDLLRNGVNSVSYSSLTSVNVPGWF